MFSIENGLLTPTFKAKRPEILRTFKEEIEHLYEEVEMDLTAKTKQGWDVYYWTLIKIPNLVWQNVNDIL